MVWGGKGDDDDDAEESRAPFVEWEVWAACLVGAVMPAVTVTMFVQLFEGKTEPYFFPGLYLGLSTILVLIIRPWTFR